MLLKVCIGLAIILVILVVIIITRPGSFRYIRSLSIAAPAELLFAQVNDLHKFQDWNPWSKVDPSAVVTYTGPDQGIGSTYTWSTYTWSGNKEVGEGTMTITGELVRARMDFRKPFAATNTVDFTFVPEGNNSVVSWTMYGPNNFMGKAISLIMDCDKRCGDQFTKGLRNLRALTETPASASPPKV